MTQETKNIKENQVQRRNYLKVKSPSKINFALWVKEKRQDGYHGIETIYFENKDLCDEIEINYLEDKKLSVNVLFNQDALNKKIPPENNLAGKAAALFLEKIGATGICEIKIDKSIPVQAGLGGGSSNAASVLKGLNGIFDYPLHESELLILAAKIGSDVPFFIIGNTCLGRSRGEILKPLENKLNLNIKIINPENISVSTKWAYDLIDSREFQTDHRSEINSLITAMQKKDYDLFFKNIFNDFEMVVFTNFPSLISKRKKLFSEGFKAVTLCGSGGALFGVKELTLT